MGTLVTRTEIQPKASWYFSDAYFSSDARDYRYDWPSKNFPYCISIHDDDLTSPSKVEIRRWIETRIIETVIYNSEVKSYRHYWDEKNSDHYSDVRNIWWSFHFESEESAVAFKLRFLDIVKEITDRHPTWHKLYERTN